MPAAKGKPTDTESVNYVEVAATVKYSALSGEEAARAQLANVDLPLKNAADQFVLTSEVNDANGVRHLRVQQVHRGVPIYGGELILHQATTGPATATGRLQLSPKPADLAPGFDAHSAIERSYSAMGGRQARLNSPVVADHVHVDKAELMLYPTSDGLRLVYVTEVAPSLAEHEVVFLDARSGGIIDRYSKVCRLVSELDEAYFRTLPTPAATVSSANPSIAYAPTFMPGPRQANAADLNGRTRAIQTYESTSGGFFLIDATRPMWVQKTKIPGDETGALVTANAQGTYPDSSFKAKYSDSPNNAWSNRAEVSAHYNGEQSYEYFRTTFARNSLNGAGKTITAFVNVSDENGAAMDNAFYTNGLLFYGNGSTAFKSLAGALDVAGHEMSHGVINFSADLEYRNESGALNEHFADVFGAMIDREDWQLGEDVVLAQAFPSGALRDMANPRQGGTSLNDRGYQPDHYRDIYVGSQDNGGVHINSGIPNRVCYLIAQTLGRADTEQLYYNVLTNYLTRTSKFIDMRNALQQAATAKYGAGSTQLNAVILALNTVGMPGTSNGGGGTQEPNKQQTNPGTMLVATQDAARQLVKVTDLTGRVIIDDITPSQIPLSRVSISDDGSAAYLVTSDGDINQIRIDYTTNTVSENLVSGDLDNDGNGDVRNVAISRDGTKLAFLTNDLDARVYVLNLATSRSQSFELYTPGSNGERVRTVDYADVLEWDYYGQNIIFDGLNTVQGNGGFSIENWDIGILNVFDGAGNFSKGEVLKLFGTLEEGTSIGNPTLAKNSEQIMAFDLVNGSGDYFTLATNLITGDNKTIWSGSDLGWPSYTADDKAIVFNAQTTTGEGIIGIREVGPDKITVSAEARGLIGDAYRATAFANGRRAISSGLVELLSGKSWSVAPNPTVGTVQVLRRADALASELPFEVYDIKGAKVLTAPGDATELDLSGLSSGVYVVRQGAVSKRVIRE